MRRGGFELLLSTCSEATACLCYDGRGQKTGFSSFQNRSNTFQNNYIPDDVRNHSFAGFSNILNDFYRTAD